MNKHNQTILMVTIFLVGLLLGIASPGLIAGMKGIKKSAFPQSCIYNGMTIQSGETVPDDCNSCSCENGEVMCTMMACAE